MTYPKFGEEELIPIVKHGRERPDLDYKGPVNWDEWPDRNKAELVRDMMALANSEVPGYIVIGATDDGGVVRSYDGLSDQEIESFDPSKIADKMKRYADPEVHFDLYKPTVDSKKYVVIRVLPFRTVPHICRTSYGDILEETAIYVRGEGARTIKVPSAEYMRRMVDRAIQISADTLVDRIRRLVSAAKKEEMDDRHRFESQIAELEKQLQKKAIDWQKYEGYREVTAYPADFSERRFEIEMLWKAAEKAEILYRGWPFIFVDPNKQETYVVDDSIETVVDLTQVRKFEYFEVWKLRQSGLFFHRALMVEETWSRATEKGKVLDLELTVYHVSEAIGSLWHLYGELGVPDNEVLTINFTYKGVKDRNLVILNPERLGFRGPQVCRSPQISVGRSLPLQEWRASEVDIAVEISAEIFVQFQWIQPNLSLIRGLASELLGKR